MNITDAQRSALQKEYPEEKKPTRIYAANNAIKSYFGTVHLYNVAFDEFIARNNPMCTYLMISGSGHYNEFKQIGLRLTEYARQLSKPQDDPERIYSQKSLPPSEYTYNIAAIVVGTPDRMSLSMESQSQCVVSAPIKYLTVTGCKRRLAENPQQKFGCITITGVYNIAALNEMMASLVVPAVADDGVVIIEYLQDGFDKKLSPADSVYQFGEPLAAPEDYIRSYFPDPLVAAVRVIPEVHGIFGLIIIAMEPPLPDEV